MDREIFNKLWEITAKKEIEKIIASCRYKVEMKYSNVHFRENVYSKYNNERRKFRKAIGMSEDSRLDRHKVAALFYAAIVDNTGGYSLEVFYNRIERLPDAEASVTHEIAFNIACGILEAIIVSNNRIDEDYRKYVAENGLVEPGLVCFKDHGDTTYKEELLKQLIYAQKENKLSVSQLAIIFSLIESNTSSCYKSRTRKH
ncbi:MAG: hypothetical protein LBC64_07390 [Fibromonadaceae bacterium]|jgi:hypothetical protein|nr:hypothetical protein [Fibromonadaceae bacterium]